MFLLPFLLNKAILISLSLIVVGSATVFGGIKANDYRQTQIIVQEAKKLALEGKYQEAINKLSESNNKWTTDGGKKEVVSLEEENRTLLESSSHYVLGKELFDKEKYADAVEVLKKVDIRHANYFDSKSLIELAEKKIETSKGEVAGVKTEVKTVKVVKVAPEVLPKPTPTPVIPTPTPEPQIDVTALCSAKKQQEAGSIAESAYKASAQAEANARSDPMFYQVWMGMQSNIQLMMKNWTVKTLGEYEAYCLTHNGDVSGWSPSSGPFDGISW